MSKQRLRLAKYLNKKQTYRATFGEICHDKKNKPHVVLLDIYPVYKNGHKVPLRSKDALTNKHGQQIAADHLWTSLTKSFLDTPFELLYGDQIQFTATVKTYKITRDNVLDDRDKIWQNCMENNEKLYQQYVRQKNELYRLANKSKEQAFKDHTKRIISFKEMKERQEEIDKLRKSDVSKAKQSYDRKIKRRIKKAQKQIKDEKLIDYTLTNIKNVEVIKPNHHFGTSVRAKYDSSRLKDLDYTKFLAAHSMLAKDDKLDQWSKENNERSVEHENSVSISAK